MKALVTGGHGFLGSHIVERLLAEGLDVRVMASPWGKLHNLEHLLDDSRLEIARGNITERNSLDEAFAGVELVYHSAARVLDWGKWEWFDQTNVDGTKNVLDAAIQAGVQRFVQVSSVAVHEYTGFRDADPRSTPTGGSRLVSYARSKKLAEELVTESPLETVIVRPGLWPYGPRDPNFIKFVGPLKSGMFPMVKMGEKIINTAYAENLAQGMFLAGTVPAAAGKSYVIADEGAPTWREALTHLALSVGGPKPWMPMPAWLSVGLSNFVEWMWSTVAPKAEPPLTKYRGAVMNEDVHFSIEAAKTELGYLPEISWQEGIERTVAWLGK
jgi:nucleoside-diphosphate-sugar epimerase